MILLVPHACLFCGRQGFCYPHIHGRVTILSLHQARGRAAQDPKPDTARNLLEPAACSMTGKGCHDKETFRQPVCQECLEVARGAIAQPM